MTDDTASPGGGRRSGGSGTAAGIPISVLLPLVLAGLVAAAVVPVLVLGFLGARENTGRLLRDRGELVIEAVIGRIAAHLDPVRAQLGYVAEAVRIGAIDPRDEESIRPFLTGTLAATPQVTGIGHVRPDRTLRRYSRENYRVFVEAWPNVPGFDDSLAWAEAHAEMRWGAPVWSPVLGETIVTLQAPLHGPRGFEGVLVAAITIADLSRYLAAVGAEVEGTPFILLGRERVLAHPMLVEGDFHQPPPPEAGSALPRIDEIGAPALARIWSMQNRLSFAPFRRAEGHWAWLSDDWWSRDGYTAYAYVYRTVSTYGAEPWTVGVYAPASETRRERWIVLGIGIGGALTLAAALAVAVWVGRVLGRPVLALAEAARRVETLDFDAVRRAGRVLNRRGAVQEINQAALAFERMAAALRWFETYLPRALVRRLVAAGAGSRGAPESETREVTVLFADLEHYTAFSTERPALEIVGYLNGFLDCVGPIIEASGGTIDKYIGDCVMAFWGAPEAQPDHAVAACRAAVAIGAAVEAFNSRRRAAGEAACRLRLGVHTGPVVVGNIGFSGRVDYTIIGTAVNTAQRLEQAGRRHIAASAETVILASEATRRAAGDDGFAFEEVADEVAAESGRVYRLVRERATAAAPAPPSI